jgi:hypothetical protein
MRVLYPRREMIIENTIVTITGKRRPFGEDTRHHASIAEIGNIAR